MPARPDPFSTFITEFECLAHQAGWRADTNGGEMALGLCASIRTALRNEIDLDLALIDVDADEPRTVYSLRYVELRRHCLRKDHLVPLSAATTSAARQVDAAPR